MDFTSEEKYFHDLFQWSMVRNLLNFDNIIANKLRLLITILNTILSATINPSKSSFSFPDPFSQVASPSTIFHIGFSVDERIRAASHCFSLSRRLKFWHTHARIYRRPSPSADGEVATLIAPAHLHWMSPRDGKIATSQRSDLSARRVAARVALTFERAARQAARDNRGQWYARSRHPSVGVTR